MYVFQDLFKQYDLCFHNLAPLSNGRTSVGRIVEQLALFGDIERVSESVLIRFKDKHRQPDLPVHVPWNDVLGSNVSDVKFVTHELVRHSRYPTD